VLADAVQGACRPYQQIAWIRADGQSEDLTGATLSGVIRAVDDGRTRAITGLLAVLDGGNGVFVWEFSPEDVAQAGSFEVQFSAAFGISPTPARTFPIKWQVHKMLTVRDDEP
jgi:hypothetical protein